MFYDHNLSNDKYIKVVPVNIEQYLTPLALAIWFMDDGSKLGKGAKIATNSFLQEDIIFLCKVLYSRYKINATIHKDGKGKGYTIYVDVKSMPVLSKIIKPHMLPTMYYKLGEY